MFSFLAANAATVIICLILAAVVALIVFSMIRGKKQGKTSCGCGCSGCPSAGICHGQKK